MEIRVRVSLGVPFGSVVELADTPALGAGPFGGVGSSPTRPTKLRVYRIKAITADC